VLTVCSQRVYLLKLLQSQGLPIQQLHMVFVVLILSRITYALPAWGGQLTSYKNVWMLFLNGLVWFFCGENYTIAELLNKADARLFRLVKRSEHCLHHLLPDTINSSSMELRHTGHSFPLPQCKYKLYKNSFISRCLFKYV